MSSVKTVHSVSPHVSTITNFITSQECQHMIDISRYMMKDSLVSIDNKGVISNGRTSMNTWIRHDYDKITMEIGQRISAIVGIPLENAESFQVIHYDKNGEYRQHYDSWVHDGSDKTLRCMKWGGARVKTALCYLNDVTKGGGTKMTKLGITISPEKGKLLLFNNTLSSDNHTRDEMSEHAGMPVEVGEKYAFNLWFKECNSKMLYKEFNPQYYNNSIQPFRNSIITPGNDIHVRRAYIDKETTNQLISKCKFNTRGRRDGWIKLEYFPELVGQIEALTDIKSDFYENINVVEYNPNILHDTHLTAYDMNSETGKRYTSQLGQRTFTITIILTDNMTINFPRIDTNKSIYGKGDIIVYKNVIDETCERNPEMARNILSINDVGYIANIYVRYISKRFSTRQLACDNIEISKSMENYMDTLDHVLMSFNNGDVGEKWNGYKSFTYIFKGSFERFRDYMSEYIYIRDSICKKQILNEKNMETRYELDKELSIQIVNDVLDTRILSLIQKYYSESIANCVWELGDRQSNRYKAHNDPMSRIIHYEILPLVEKIVGRKMRPTYTYLSAYVNGAELPPHTDRADCEYTVSFVIDKPEGINWNIYIHKVRQPVKFKGRYDIKPSIYDCEGVDCNAGGLMLFQGTDHIHFREKLIGEYYNIILLHYVSV